MQPKFKSIASGLLTLIVAHAATTARADEAHTDLVWASGAGVVGAEMCEPIRLSAQDEAALGGNMALYISRANQVDQYINFPGSGHVVTNSLWQAARNEAGELLGLACETENTTLTYVSFSVFDPSILAPIAVVGVTSEDASLFELKTDLTTPVRDNAPPALDLPSGIPVTEGTAENVICLATGTVDVRDESLAAVLFKASGNEAVKIYQAFGGAPDSDLIKVQFEDREEGMNTGWVPKEAVKAKAACASMPASLGTSSNASFATVATLAQSWTFPTLKRPMESYRTGMRAFNATRNGGGRTHAACDLYRNKNEQAVSVTSGTIVRDRYYFYEGTYAIEVKLNGGKIARYGEITGKRVPNVKLHTVLKTGQVVGYVAKVNSNCCKPMLHFEMYAGTSKGSLSQRGNKYNRRRDLINPTKLLQGWEKAAFGSSY